MMNFSENQRQAIKTALSNHISIITGPPGSGKSFILRGIVDIYKNLYPRNHIYLCAPTGRAAKRMKEATGYEAKTIHRLLRYHPGVNEFEHGYNNPLPGPGLLIADEVSMMDIKLAASLLAAVDDLQVVLVGDIDQLPSVGPGSVLRDIIASGCVPTTRLLFNYRQSNGSKVAELANMICRGDVPELRNEGDFEYIPVEDGDQAAQVVLQLVAGIVAEKRGPLEWSVLAPMRRGSCGVIALNEQIRELVNPAREGELTLGRYRLRDKCMVIKNHYGLGVFNGDVGIVIDVKKNSLTVNFGNGQAVEFTVEDLDILVLAYASTIHKSQGSEFPVVIMPLVQQHYMMLQRNLLYTGITRAKSRLVLVAEERSVKQAVRNAVVEERHSMLAERIRNGGGTEAERRRSDGQRARTRKINRAPGE